MNKVREMKGGKREKSYPTSTVRKRVFFFPLGYIVFTQMWYCVAEIKINSFVSCDLFISQSTRVWFSVILMEKLRSYY